MRAGGAAGDSIPGTTRQAMRSDGFRTGPPGSPPLRTARQFFGEHPVWSGGFPVGCVRPRCPLPTGLSAAGKAKSGRTIAARHDCLALRWRLCGLLATKPPYPSCLASSSVSCPRMRAPSSHRRSDDAGPLDKPSAVVTGFRLSDPGSSLRLDPGPSAGTTPNYSPLPVWESLRSNAADDISARAKPNESRQVRRSVADGRPLRELAKRTQPDRTTSRQNEPNGIAFDVSA